MFTRCAQNHYHICVYRVAKRVLFRHTSVCVSQKISLLNNRPNLAYTGMAAARYSADVLQMFYGPINPRENALLQRPILPQEEDNVFMLAQNNFEEWLRVWRMDIPERKAFSKDLFKFARETKTKFAVLVEKEIKALSSVKVSFVLSVDFSIERNGKIQKMNHYFKGEPIIFDRSTTKDEIHRKNQGRNRSLVSKGIGVGS